MIQLECYNLHFWGCWCLPCIFCFQLVKHPSCHLFWCASVPVIQRGWLQEAMCYTFLNLEISIQGSMLLNALPWKWTEIILSFWKLHSSPAFQTLCLFWGLLNSSMVFLPTSIWYNGHLNFNWPISVHFGSQISWILLHILTKLV